MGSQASRRARPEEPTGTDASAAERVVCPLCGVPATDERAVYIHLQTSHRKSALAGLVVGRADAI